MTVSDNVRPRVPGPGVPGRAQIETPEALTRAVWDFADAHATSKPHH